MMSRKRVGRMFQHGKTTPSVPHAVTPALRIPPTIVALKAVWTAITDAFAQATQTTAQLVDYFYCINRRVVRLRFASAALAGQLTPALAHLATTPHPTPALTIKLWDSATTGVALPLLPATLQQTLPPAEQWGTYAHSERFHAFWQPIYQLFTMLDNQQQEALYWVQDAKQLPLAEGSAPLLTLLHWWLGQQGGQVVHGAAVGTAAGSALLVGKSGSGKSTTALACLNAGLTYLGDDYCLVTATPQPTVYSLYSSGKMHFADRVRFPRLQPTASANHYADADKALYFFAEAFADQIVPSLPLKALLLPVIKPAGPSKVSPVSAAMALLALGPSTVFQLVGEKQQSFHHLGQLVRQLPCYRVELGPDITQLPGLIAEVLAKP